MTAKELMESPKETIQAATPQLLDELIESARQFVHHLFEKEGNGCRLTPMLLTSVFDFATQQNEIINCVLAGPFNEWEERVDAMKMVARDLHRQMKMPLAIVLTSEMWMATSRKDKPRVEPRHAKNRVDCIGCAGLTIAKDYRFICGRRPKAGQKLTLLENEIYADMKFPILEVFWRALATSALEVAVMNAGKPYGQNT